MQPNIPEFLRDRPGTDDTVRNLKTLRYRGLTDHLLVYQLSTAGLTPSGIELALHAIVQWTEHKGHIAISSHD